MSVDTRQVAIDASIRLSNWNPNRPVEQVIEDAEKIHAFLVKD